MVNIIVAMDDHGLIGKDNALPWHIPEDMKIFRELTVGNVVIMGRKTFESLGRPNGLPNRDNVVLTTKPFVDEGVVSWSNSLLDVLDTYSGSIKELFIIGGASIYSQALDIADTMYISRVHGSYEGNVYFPDVDWDKWQFIRGDKHETFTFEVYNRKK